MNTFNAKDKLLLLIERGLTERQISEGTGIPQPTINRIKNGREPRETYVRVIDTYFAQQGYVDVSYPNRASL
jgi:predicted transcriptional regulator